MSSATDPAPAPSAHELASMDFVRRNQHVMGAGAADWTCDQTMAWVGLMLAHQSLFRGFGQAVEHKHGLSPTALGLLGRLSQEPAGGTLRITALSSDVGLSLSRTSRVVDGLESRGLVVRVPCPSDARATNVLLSKAGHAMVADAQATTNTWVHENFFGRLTDEETASLAGILERFAVDTGGSPCDAAATPAAPCGGAAGDC